jgi:hypothetical protein
MAPGGHRGERSALSPQPRTRSRSQPKGGERSAGELFKGIGETLGTLAGLAVFVYVIGGLTVLVRLDRLELSGEVVIPEIPRERLALLGLAQVLWTLVLGGLIAVAALVLLRGSARGKGEAWGAWWRRLRSERKREWIPALVLLVVIVLIAPVSLNGFLYLAVLLFGVGWLMASGRTPSVGSIAAVVASLLIAAAITVLREREFPEPFDRAEVALSKEKVAGVPEAVQGRVSGRVIESTDDELLLGYEAPEIEAREKATGERIPPNLLVIPQGSVDRILYQGLIEPQSHSESVAQVAFGWAVRFPLVCLVPTCEWDDSGEVEHREPTFSPPFSF